ncbi:hypothetical protein ACFL23_02625 [Patescibacteria group bacterium]
MKMQLKKVLIIEGNAKWRIEYLKQLDGIVKILFAKTLEEANKIFENNYEILNAVAIISHINSDEINTISLVKKISAKLPETIPIFAVTVTLEDRQPLINAGCTHGCSKKDFPKELCEVLNLDFNEYRN